MLTNILLMDGCRHVMKESLRPVSQSYRMVSVSKCGLYREVRCLRWGDFWRVIDFAITIHKTDKPTVRAEILNYIISLKIHGQIRHF